MESDFYDMEKLYRAIQPIAPFLKEDGTVSSGAFKDKKGLSVDKQMHRKNEDAVEFIKKSKKGDIYSVTTNNCDEKEIKYVYLPIEDNKFHAELHKNLESKELTRSQAKYLASKCKKET